MNTFKIFLSDEVAIPQDLICKDEDEMGPPGHQAFMLKITQSVGDDIPKEAREWAVRMIFSNIVHLGLCSCTATMKEKAQNHEKLCPHNIDASLRIHTRAIVEFIKTNPTTFLI